MRSRSEVEVAWAAGMFESRGIVTSTGRLELKMKDEQSLARFCKAVGAGKVYGPYGPYETALGHTPRYWAWIAWNGQEVVRVADLLAPIMSSTASGRLMRSKGDYE